MKRMIGAPGTHLKKIGMHSCVIGALGPVLNKMNRNVLNTNLIKIGSPTDLFKSGPFSPYEKPPNCS